MKLLSSASRPRSWLAAVITLLLGTRLAASIELQIDDPESIKRAAGIAAKNMLSYYSGEEYGQVPGLLPYPPYYWWESGAMWMSLIEYWWYTGDNQYNELITKGVQWQTGPGANFILTNQSFDNGNDDQAFWAFAAMDAAELKFPNPPKDQPQWLALAQAVYNVQLTRFTKTCGGGLPWQVYDTTPGYYYKNTISNGCFFALAGRLARYTGNATYAHYAETTYDWMVRAGLIYPDFQIWDGVDTLSNCTVNGILWTYNAGVVLQGAAYMWSFTKKEKWRKRVDGILDSLHIFFDNGVMYEQWCEGSTEHPCNTDQQSFKGYLARWMAVTSQLCPWTYPRIRSLLETSAQAAAAQCTGGTSGTVCGLQWTIKGETGVFDNIYGAGEEMAAMNVFASLLTPSPQEKKHPKNKHEAHLSQGPVTHVHGTSKGNPGAGLSDMTPTTTDLGILHVTTGDRAGAWILTIVFALLTIGGAVWCIRDDGKPFTYLAKSPRSSPNPKSWKEKTSQWPSPSINSPNMRQSQINSPTRVLHSKYGTPGVSSPVVGIASPPRSIQAASKRTSINSKRASDKPTGLRQPPSSPR